MPARWAPHFVTEEEEASWPHVNKETLKFYLPVSVYILIALSYLTFDAASNEIGEIVAKSLLNPALIAMVIVWRSKLAWPKSWAFVAVLVASAIGDIALALDSLYVGMVFFTVARINLCIFFRPLFKIDWVKVGISVLIYGPGCLTAQLLIWHSESASTVIKWLSLVYVLFILIDAFVFLSTEWSVLLAGCLFALSDGLIAIVRFRPDLGLTSSQVIIILYALSYLIFTVAYISQGSEQAPDYQSVQLETIAHEPAATNSFVEEPAEEESIEHGVAESV